MNNMVELCRGRAPSMLFLFATVGAGYIYLDR